MRCVICRHGEVNPGVTTVTLQRGQATLVFKDVPARICENCGEAYVDEEVAGLLLRATEQAALQGVEVDVRSFAAAVSP